MCFWRQSIYWPTFQLHALWQILMVQLLKKKGSTFQFLECSVMINILPVNTFNSNLKSRLQHLRICSLCGDRVSRLPRALYRLHCCGIENFLPSMAFCIWCTPGTFSPFFLHVTAQYVDPQKQTVIHDLKTF